MQNMQKINISYLLYTCIFCIEYQHYRLRVFGIWYFYAYCVQLSKLCTLITGNTYLTNITKLINKMTRHYCVNKSVMGEGA